MENLYQLENHVIVYEKEEGIITFIKDLEVDSIFFENEFQKSFEFEYCGIVYENQNFRINKIDFDPNGKYLIAEYISMDTKITLKEIFRYVGRNILERYYLFCPRFSGMLKYFTMYTGEVKTKCKSDLIIPLRSDYLYTIDEEIEMKKAPLEGAGIVVIKNETESLITWYFNKEKYATPRIKEKKIIYQIDYNEKIDQKQETVLGGQYYKFYEGNYIEALESISKFYKIEGIAKEILDQQNTVVRKYYGPLYYATKDRYCNSAFTDLLDSIFQGKSDKENIKEWLKIQQAIRPRGTDNFYYSLKSKLSADYPKDFINMAAILIYVLGDVERTKKMEQLLKQNNINFDDEILKFGKIYFDYIYNEKSVFAFVKKYKDLFYMVAVNITEFPVNESLELTQEFVSENLKLNSYKIKNIVSNKIEMSLRDPKKIDLHFEGYEAKLISFEFNNDDIMEGSFEEKVTKNDYVAIKNNFYEVFFLKNHIFPIKIKNRDLILRNFKTNIILKKDKLDWVIDDFNLSYMSKNAKIKYTIKKNNCLDFEIESFDLDKKVYFEFDYNDVSYMLKDNKIKKNITDVGKNEKITFIGKNIFKFELREKNFDKIKIKSDLKKTKIEYKSENGKKYNLKFRIYMI